MPHFHIEYSANLEDVVDMAALCETLRAVAAGLDAFPMAGVRVRATRVDHVAIARAPLPMGMRQARPPLHAGFRTRPP